MNKETTIIEQRCCYDNVQQIADKMKFIAELKQLPIAVETGRLPCVTGYSDKQMSQNVRWHIY